MIVANHLETKIRIDPTSNKAFLEFSWDGQQSSASTSSSSVQAMRGGGGAAQSAPPHQTDNAAQVKYDDNIPEKKEYTFDDVAKHNDKEDPWLIVNGEVLQVKEFLPDHPGGKLVFNVQATISIG